MVQPDDDVTHSVSSITADTEVTSTSIDPFMHTDGGFPEGPVEWSMLTDYVDHVALRIWKGEVYVFYV